jgi:hypothetical protein
MTRTTMPGVPSFDTAPSDMMPSIEASTRSSISEGKKLGTRIFITSLLLVLSSVAHANVITFSGSGSVNSETASASAAFTYTPGATGFTVTLSNTSLVHSAGNLLSDLEFTLAAGTVALSSSSATEVTVSGSGVITPGSTVSTGWGFGNTGGSNFLLCIICGNGVTPGAITPAHTITSTTIAGNVTPSASGSGPHSPFLASGATFSFTTTQALSANPFSNVVFSFGTEFGHNISGTPGTGDVQATPEPVSFILAGAGLLAIAKISRRASRRA